MNHPQVDAQGCGNQEISRQLVTGGLRRSTVVFDSSTGLRLPDGSTLSRMHRTRRERLRN
jgi:hypothetical protein